MNELRATLDRTGTVARGAGACDRMRRGTVLRSRVRGYRNGCIQSRSTVETPTGERGQRRDRDRVLVLMAGAHIDRTAVQRWEHRILSDAVARRYDAVARRYDAVARRYPTGVSSYCIALGLSL